MAHRQFSDPHGARWDVWDVYPTIARDALARLYPPRAGAPGHPCDDVASDLAAGWLCFERSGERRRLAPIPPCWDELPAATLVELCARAAPVPRPASAEAVDELRR